MNTKNSEHPKDLIHHLGLFFNSDILWGSPHMRPVLDEILADMQKAMEISDLGDVELTKLNRFICLCVTVATILMHAKGVRHVREKKITFAQRKADDQRVLEYMYEVELASPRPTVEVNFRMWFDDEAFSISYKTGESATMLPCSYVKETLEKAPRCAGIIPAIFLCRELQVGLPDKADFPIESLPLEN